MIVRTSEGYDAAFEAERRNAYPVMDLAEARFGFAIGRDRLEAAARVLACPLKKNPPNWQHGRLIYAVLARRLQNRLAGDGGFVDVGTAKGFSALCMAWALSDHAPSGATVHSFDIIDPASREARNSVEDGKTVAEFVAPFWPDDVRHVFDVAGNMGKRAPFVSGGRICFSFVDGSHTYAGVRGDIEKISPFQEPGDIIVFDDLHIQQVRAALMETLVGYDIETVELLAMRHYGIAIKK